MRLKNCKLFGKRGLSVLLSLVLCMGMASPAFAAMDLKDALDEETGKWKSAEDRMAAVNTETNVEEYYLNEDLELKKTLLVGTGGLAETQWDANAPTNVSIELNGHKLQRNKTNEDGSLVPDEDGNLKKGPVISVGGENTSLTITDKTSLVEDENGEQHYVAGAGTGEISGGYGVNTNYYLASGGGISVQNGATFEMDGGKITNNQAVSFRGSRTPDHGGGIKLMGGTVKLNGVEVSNNESVGRGGGLYLLSWNKKEIDVEIKNSTIEGNAAGNYGGGVYIKGPGKVAIENTRITDNEAGTQDEGDSGVYATGPDTKVIFQGENVVINQNVGNRNNTSSNGSIDMRADNGASITIEQGSKLTTTQYGEVTYLDGGAVGYEGANSSKVPTVTKTVDEEKGTVTIVTDDGKGTDDSSKTITISNAAKDDVKVDAQGNTNVPAGGKVTDESGNETTYPDGATIDAQGKITAKNHTEETIPAVAATCTATGLTEGKKCSVCGEILVAQETTEMVPHTEETIPAVAATCTATGLTEGKKCSVCGEILVAQQPTEMVDHTEEIIPAVPATETESGWTEGTRCSVCDTILRAPVEIPATGPVNPENPEQPENPENPETPETPDVPAPGGDDDFSDDGAGTATIAEQEVPLAGIVLVKDVLAELYKHAGSPDGEDAEGEYVKAIAWAIANGIVDADYDVESVVTVAVLKEMLTNYAASVGGVLTVSIDGEDDDVVMNCGEILAEALKTL